MENVHPFQCQENIRAEARAWVLKFNGDAPPTNADIAALREWTRRSPAHRAALERAQAFWVDADRLSELAVPLGRYGNQAKPGFFGRFLAALLSFNRVSSMTAVLLVGLVVAGSFWLLPLSGGVGNGTYDTAIGEQKLLTLADKSRVQLDTNSQVRVEYSEGLRRIYLLRGKAHFDVAKDSQRPFEVYAGEGMVRAVGTAFSVYLIDRDIQVTVDEGRVDLARTSLQVAPADEIESGSQPSNSVVNNHSENENVHDVFLSLDKGQSALFNRDREKVSELADKDLSRDLAWRSGLLIFTGEPLSQVVSEVSRYTETRIEISDPELGELPIGGRFRVGKLEALFDALEAGFGVQVSYLGKDHIQLRSASE